MAYILAVDDAPEHLLTIERYLSGDEFQLVTARDGLQALELCQQQEFDLVLLDVRMTGIDGFETCRRLKSNPRTAFIPVIFLTGHFASESSRQEAFEIGAVDYVQKPVRRDELRARIRVMLRMQEARNRLTVENDRLQLELLDARRRLEDARREIADLRQLAAMHADDAASSSEVAAIRERIARRRPAEAGGAPAAAASTGDPSAAEAGEADAVEAGAAARAHYRVTGFVGQAPAVREVYDMVDRLRSRFSTVLVRGETGTGKELVARALHFDGPHRRSPFIPIHCGGIQASLAESELFGHVKGSFTGATRSQDGLFVAADGGTIFLDEVAEMPLDVQVKLLRVLQYGEVRPVGGTDVRLVDVRVIAATHRDLREMVEEGTFRQDLYYRLSTVTVELPPLREHLDDLPALARHFLERGNRRDGREDRPVRGLSRGALARLQAYDWPGNVRELENVFARAFSLNVGELIHEEDLPPDILRATDQPDGGDPEAADALPSLGRARAAAEREAMRQALQRTGGNARQAMQLLGLSRATFYRRKAAYGL